MCNMQCMDCDNELSLHRLCAKKSKIICLCNDTTVSKSICADEIQTINLSSQNGNANNICVSNALQASQVSALNVNTNTLCSQSGTINNLCVNNLTVGSLNHCAKWRAAVTFNANTTYTLGSPFNWNTVLDDPNNNISMSPFSYTVPTSGYYMISFHVDSKQLMGSELITGVPVGALRILHNGNELRTQYSPFLSFSDEQKTSLTSLCLLNAGDVVTMDYNVLVVDSTSGLQPYVGTVVIEANGTFPGESGFAIHYLSSLNCSTITCAACPAVTIPCQPLTIDCTKVTCPQPNSTPEPMGPCDSCQ